MQSSLCVRSRVNRTFNRPENRQNDRVFSLHFWLTGNCIGTLISWACAFAACKLVCCRRCTFSISFFFCTFIPIHLQCLRRKMDKENEEKRPSLAANATNERQKMKMGTNATQFNQSRDGVIFPSHFRADNYRLAHVWLFWLADDNSSHVRISVANENISVPRRNNSRSKQNRNLSRDWIAIRGMFSSLEKP